LRLRYEPLFSAPNSLSTNGLVSTRRRAHQIHQKLRRLGNFIPCFICMVSLCVYDYDKTHFTHVDDIPSCKKSDNCSVHSSFNSSSGTSFFSKAKTYLPKTVGSASQLQAERKINKIRGERTSGLKSNYIGSSVFSNHCRRGSIARSSSDQGIGPQRVKLKCCDCCLTKNTKGCKALPQSEQSLWLSRADGPTL
jgi:hypothetical protein